MDENELTEWAEAVDAWLVNLHQKLDWEISVFGVDGPPRLSEFRRG